MSRIKGRPNGISKKEGLKKKNVKFKVGRRNSDATRRPAITIDARSLKKINRFNEKNINDWTFEGTYSEASNASTNASVTHQKPGCLGFQSPTSSFAGETSHSVKKEPPLGINRFPLSLSIDGSS
jgi:hypothetical protein